MEIKVELLRLGKLQKDLILELNKRGINCAQQEVSSALAGLPRPKFDRIRAESEKIIEEWKEKKNYD
jgi:hypothetical protein